MGPGGVFSARSNSSIAEAVEPVAPEDEVWKAMREMNQRRLPQLPVVEEGVLIGTLTQAEILRGLELRELEEPEVRPPWALPERGEAHP